MISAKLQLLKAHYASENIKKLLAQTIVKKFYQQFFCTEYESAVELLSFNEKYKNKLRGADVL